MEDKPSAQYHFEHLGYLWSENDTCIELLNAKIGKWHVIHKDKKCFDITRNFSLTELIGFNLIAEYLKWL